MYAYDPERLFARFTHQVDATYVHRMDVPVHGKLTIRNLRKAVVLGCNIVLWVGLLSNYRRSFWRAARRALKRGQIDAALGMGLVAYHLIQFSREALRGDQNASFYSARSRALTPPIGPRLEDAATLSQ
jgi:hopanoid C-2 methylase